MELEFKTIRFRKDPVAWKEFTISPSGTIGSDLKRRGRHLVFLAQRSVQKKHGRLAASINMQYIAVNNPYVRVGSNSKKALMMHEGTEPHWITPEHQKTLRFSVKGKVVYARRVHHPGTRGSFYLTRHLRKVIK